MLFYLILSIYIAILADLLLGDPKNHFHPVAWLGKFISLLIRLFKRKKLISEKINGIILFLAIVFSIMGIVHYGIYLTYQFLGFSITVIFIICLFKLTFAIKGMEIHVKRILFFLKENDLISARSHLSMIVRRDTNDLNENYILSAIVECIAESTVDGIISPLFYFTFLGPTGSWFYRTVNTLDSMIGYKDKYFQDLGWFSANCDTIVNYIPARFVALLTIMSAAIVRLDWRSSYKILLRDYKITESKNAGFPMSAMAGALNVKLEKIGNYSLGDENELLTISKCILALRIMKINTLLFSFIFSIPVIIVLNYLGWWNFIFGFI